MKLRLTFSGRAQQENVVGKFFLRMRGKSQFVRVPDPQLRGEENKKKHKICFDLPSQKLHVDNNSNKTATWSLMLHLIKKRWTRYVEKVWMLVTKDGHLRPRAPIFSADLCGESHKNR